MAIKKKTTASEFSITIPPEIITEILYRLPAKSVGRFRCVSKDWLSLLSSPQFIKTHQNTLNRNHIIFHPRYDENRSNHLFFYILPFNQHEITRKHCLLIDFADYFAFHGSCNGLVLLSVFDSTDSQTLVIINPTIKQYVDLPISKIDVVEEIRINNIAYGFGYDSLTDDYKVVTVSFYDKSPDNIPVHIYSLKTDTWKWVVDSPCDHSYVKYLPGVFVNGFLHWIVKKRSDGLPVIVAFSLADEKFSEVPSPNLRNDHVDIMSKDNSKLVDLGGKLGIFLKVEGAVYLMNEYGVKESWTKIILHKFNEHPMVDPMIFSDSGKILLVSNDRMLIYDIGKRSFCKCVDITRNLKALKVRGTFVESLVSL